MTAASYELQLIGGMAVETGGQATRPCGVEARLLALLALAGRALGRSTVAGTLWADASESHACGSLRSALWRVRRHLPSLVVADRDRLWLSPTAVVDLAGARARARSAIADPTVAAATATEQFERDLLPDLWEHWLIHEQERYRQLRLNALEAVARAHADRGQWAQAIDAATTAIVAEPLRESAHRLLVQIHVAAGNLFEARRAHDSFRRLSADVTGFGPSPAFDRMLRRGG